MAAKRQALSRGGLLRGAPSQRVVRVRALVASTATYTGLVMVASLCLAIEVLAALKLLKVVVVVLNATIAFSTCMLLT